MAAAPIPLTARLAGLLREIYPAHDAEALAEQAIAAFWPEGRVPRDSGRAPANDLWSSEDAVVITYGDTLLQDGRKPLTVLNEFLDRYLGGVVSAVHVLPFFPYTSDDGFAVTDYRKVNPDLGDWPDIGRIGGSFRLMSDLVLNHVSSQSPWFQAYLAGQPPYDRFFFEAAPEDDLSAVVRPRTSPLLQKVETANGPRHVWCTFSFDQVDLNFANPEVLLEMIRIIRLHLDQGVEIIRLDAVAFVWKEPGTASIHLPQTHAIVKLLRTLADFAAEPVILLTETNVPKAENLSYFGDLEEAHSIYNFPLPPLVLHALMSGSARLLTDWARSMPPAPLGCAYFNFTASHDGVGMRPAEGLIPHDEIARMIDTVKASGGLTSMRTLPDGGQSVYEVNTSYFSALSRTFAGADDRHIARFVASQTMVMSLEGMPAFYIHSLLATPNDLEAVERRGINRAINRHRWDWPTLRAQLDDPTTPQARVLAALSERLRLRARQPAFHPNATQYTLALDDRLFAVWRQSLDRSQSIFALHNVSAEAVTIPAAALNLIADIGWIDLLSGEEVTPGSGRITLAPYQCRWISNRP